MNQTIEWIQSNWYELGSLIAQFTFLFAVLCFAQKVLRTMRASQQQLGALLRLSMSDGLEEPPKESDAIPPSSPSVVASAVVSPDSDRPTAPTPGSTSYVAFEKPPRSEAPWLRDELNGRAKASAPITLAPTTEPIDEPTAYVAAPLTLPSDEESGRPVAAAGRGAVQWLQTPMAVKRARSSPWRRVVRWLQAPVRS